jgi:hypothetical protein
VESEREIAVSNFAAKHPELHHYTDFKGLRGIVETNTLWATHFDHLNDKMEVMLLKKPMMESLSARLYRALQTGKIGNRHKRRALARKDNIEREVYIFVEALFDTSFKRGPTQPLAEPHISSFCAHQKYETANGLLSQWRAYGGAERYCVVLDTAKLIEMLEHEFGTHYWVYMRLAEVH